MPISITDNMLSHKKTALTTQLVSAGINPTDTDAILHYLIPASVAHLVETNTNKGLEATLNLLNTESADANWPHLDRTSLQDYLQKNFSLSSVQASAAIHSVVSATQQEVTSLLPHHSLVDLLASQTAFLTNASSGSAESTTQPVTAQPTAELTQPNTAAKHLDKQEEKAEEKQASQPSAANPVSQPEASHVHHIARDVKQSASGLTTGIQKVMVDTAPSNSVVRKILPLLALTLLGLLGLSLYKGYDKYKAQNTVNTSENASTAASDNRQPAQPWHRAI